MKRGTSLNDLLMEELVDLYNAENQLADVLPKIVAASQSTALKMALEDHWEVTKEQADRLEDVFINIRQRFQGAICKPMQELVQESEDIIDRGHEGTVRDTAIIRIMQKIKQYEINVYQRACEHAIDLGYSRIVELLNEILNEERSMNLRLNELAQYMINVQAINPQPEGQMPEPYKSSRASSGFYIAEDKFERKGNKKKFKDDFSRFMEEENPNFEDNQPKERNPGNNN